MEKPSAVQQVCTSFPRLWQVVRYAAAVPPNGEGSFLQPCWTVVYPKSNPSMTSHLRCQSLLLEDIFLLCPAQPESPHLDLWQLSRPMGADNFIHPQSWV